MDKKEFKTKSFRAGGYTVAASCVLLVILIIINALVGALPSTATQYDITTNRLYTLSDQTKDIAATLDRDVTIYWLVRPGQEDASLETLLDRYKALSGYIHVERIDPDVYPYFASQYTDATVTDNCMIVVCDDISKFIDSGDIYEYDYLLYMYSGEVDADFAGEGIITGAIDFVVNGTYSKMYQIVGHGEMDVPIAYKTALNNDNIELEELSLLSTYAIPEDCSGLMMTAPKTDITEDEAGIILDYLKQGGKLLLVTTPSDTGETFPNLMSVLAYYGCSLVDGIIIEAEQGSYVQNPLYLLPDLEMHAVTQPLKENNYFVMLPLAQGIEIAEPDRDTLSVDRLLNTSANSISKADAFNMTSFEIQEGDSVGPFAVAVSITDVLDSTGDLSTQIFWCTSRFLLDENTSSRVSGGNQDLFVNAANWMSGHSLNITIQSKHYSNDYLTIPENTATLLTIIFAVVVPLAALLIGVFVWIRRRKL